MSKGTKDHNDGSTQNFGEALARLIQAHPMELPKAVGAEIVHAHDRARQKIAAARKEIDDGARPKKGRFRL